MTPDMKQLPLDDLRIDDAELFADEREWIEFIRRETEEEIDRENETRFARYGY